MSEQFKGSIGYYILKLKLPSLLGDIQLYTGLTMFSVITFWISSTREGGRALSCCLDVFAICQTTILLLCKIELVVDTWFDNSSELQGLRGRRFEALMRGMPRILLSLCSFFRQLYKHQRSNYLSRLHANEANRARNRLVNVLLVNIGEINFSVLDEDSTLR